MKRDTMIGIAVGLAVGLVVGYFVGSNLARGPAPVVAAPAMPPPGMPPPGMPPGGMPGAPSAQAALEIQQRIAAAQQLVTRDPKNVQAWIQLGNDYFDTRQAQKSVDAYARALELQPNNPDVLTDQGIMYRDLGQFDKAIANFEKANKIDPKHLQSLFNLGVVLASDKKQPDKAIKAWNRVIEVNPSSPQAIQARQAIEELKARGAAR